MNLMNKEGIDPFPLLRTLGGKSFRFSEKKSRVRKMKTNLSSQQKGI